jgi:1-acyl-sn-glycerol-3-phosphate acyltransferase
VFVYPAKYDLDIYIMAKSELFGKFWFKWIMKHFNVFSIDREKADVRSMLKSLSVFKTNEKAKLLMFPEGKVVKTEEEAGNVYKKGAAFIASHLAKPIIPVYITRRPKFFHKVDVTYGEPFFVSEVSCENENKIEFLSKEIIRRIYDLR